MLAVATAAFAVVLVFATHYPKPEELLGRRLPSDKTLHFAAYAMLTTLAAATLAAAGRWTSATLVRLGSAVAVFGMLDEATQPLFSRVAEPRDWMFDCLGIAAGMLAVAAALALVRRPRGSHADRT
ncbi:MAG: VanZ family protein [Pirellulales bacterium]